MSLFCAERQVRKDVLRTDRYHHYYSGDSDDDDNENVTALLNVLTTYALNHKDRYCQGMSDLASPLLYAMKGTEYMPPMEWSCDD